MSDKKLLKNSIHPKLPCHVRVTGDLEGLMRIELLPPNDTLWSWCGDETHRETFEQWLTEYLKGQQPQTTLPLPFKGSPFSKRVLQTLAVIPFGETTSYGKLADAAGYPRAARAVGRVMNANPFPLVIPCHRVLAANGLGGFALGEEMKRGLLAFEGSPFAINSNDSPKGYLFTLHT